MSRWSASGGSWARPGRRTELVRQECAKRDGGCQGRLGPQAPEGAAGEEGRPLSATRDCSALGDPMASLWAGTQSASLCTTGLSKRVHAAAARGRRVVLTWVLQDIQAAIAGMREAQQVAEARIAELEAMRREPRPALDDAQKSSASGAAAVQLPAESDMHRLAHALDARERSLGAAGREARAAAGSACGGVLCERSIIRFSVLLACSIDRSIEIHLLHKHHDAPLWLAHRWKKP